MTREQLSPTTARQRRWTANRPLDGGVNRTWSRGEQADKALAEPFKHAEALKAAQRDSARIDQLMADAAKPEEPAQPESPAEVRSRPLGDHRLRTAGALS